MVAILIAWLLIHSATLTWAGGTAIPITLYTDHACDTPSSTAANVSLEIGVCAVTPGLASFDLQPYPCSSGNVAQYVFSDTACGQVDEFSYYSGGSDGHCYIAYRGDMAAIMLSCDQTNPGPPTSTTTINVGPIATGGASTSSSPSTGTSSIAGSGDGDDSTSTNPSSPMNGWNNLDSGARIGIIVALAVGIPPIILTIYMILQKRKKEQRERAQEEGQAHGTPMLTYPHFQGGSNGAFQAGGRPPHSGPLSQPMSLQQKWAAYSSMNGGGGGGGA